MHEVPTPRLRFWRWLFLISETLIVVTFVAAVTLDLGRGLDIGRDSEFIGMALLIFCMPICLFLLVGSPFFFRSSLRTVAIVGWIMALVIFLAGLLVPVRAAHKASDRDEWVK